MKRSMLIALLRIAGYHDDMKAFTRLYVENRIKLFKAKQAFAEGKQLRAGGVGCTCYECRAP